MRFWFSQKQFRRRCNVFAEDDRKLKEKVNMHAFEGQYQKLEDYLTRHDRAFSLSS